MAVIISLFEAFTFAPLLTAYFARPLNVEKKTPVKESKKGHGERFDLWQVGQQRLQKRSGLVPAFPLGYSGGIYGHADSEFLDITLPAHRILPHYRSGPDFRRYQPASGDLTG